MEGLGEDIAGCRGLPFSGCNGMESVAVEREGKGGAADCCRSSSEDCKDMGGMLRSRESF